MGYSNLHTVSSPVKVSNSEQKEKMLEELNYLSGKIEEAKREAEKSSELSIDIGALHEDIKLLEKTKGLLISEISELNKDVETTKWSLKKIDSEKSAVVLEIDEIKKQKILISESVQRDISAERESLLVLKRECEIAKAKVDVLESERKTLLSNISSLNEMVKTVESKKASLDSELFGVSEKIYKANSELLALKSEITSKSGSISVLSAEIAALKSQKTELQNDTATLKSEYFFFQEKYKNESDALIKRESDISFKEAMLDDRQKKLRDIKLFLEKEKGKAIPITI